MKRFFLIFLMLIWSSVFVWFFTSVLNTVIAQEGREVHVEVITVCGDGFAQPGIEFCDPGGRDGAPPDTGTTTCQDIIDPYSASGTPFVSGILTCDIFCTYFSTSTCYTCGNGFMKIGMEECDGSDFGGATCATYGYNVGSLACTNDCRLDLSNCSIVGVEEPQPGAVPTTGGGGGGNSRSSQGFNPGQKEETRITKVIINGKSYPNSDVRVLIDGQVVGIVKSDSQGTFDFSSEDVTAGMNTFGLWSEDNKGLKSTLLTLTFRVASKSVTTISNAYISPTIDIDKKKVKKGEDVTVFGQSFPESDVRIHVNSETKLLEDTNSNGVGEWRHTFNTTPLEEDFHTAKAVTRIVSPDGIIESNFSRTISFYVGDDVVTEDNCGIADLNCDGLVNLIDFSILLFNWGSKDANSDINSDGSVGLVDFSVMMFYWTG